MTSKVSISGLVSASGERLYQVTDAPITCDDCYFDPRPITSPGRERCPRLMGRLRCLDGNEGVFMIEIDYLKRQMRP